MNFLQSIRRAHREDELGSEFESLAQAATSAPNAARRPKGTALHKQAAQNSVSFSGWQRFPRPRHFQDRRSCAIVMRE